MSRSLSRRAARKPTAATPLNPMRPDAALRRTPLCEVPVPSSITAWAISEINSYVRCYRFGECSVIVTKEYGLWHLSIAHHERYPTWDEIAEARYRIIPDEAWMAMTLPPKASYVNLHRNCFQLVECPALKERQ